jgi:glycosyltransferase involved in cell wall biosynthesis
LDDLLNQAKRLEEGGQLQEAVKIYKELIAHASNAVSLSQFQCQFGLFCFRQQYYEAALQSFIVAHRFGDSDMKKKIFTAIHEAYYLPNCETLKITYEKNAAALRQRYPESPQYAFENLPLQFIPASDHKFHQFNRQKQEFGEIFCLSASPESDQELLGDSLIIGNEYRVSQLLHYQQLLSVGQKSILYAGYDPADVFFSYLQTANWQDVLASPKVRLFFSLDEISRYFSLNEQQRPRQVLPIPDHDPFGIEYFIRQELFQTDSANVPTIEPKPVSLQQSEQGNRFMHSGDEKVLLSICIPTWNRGGRALAAVQHILQLSEAAIEIVVSDNGSQDPDGKYRELSLLDDSRLFYHRNEENIGFGRNLLKLLELAKGKFVFLLSDEDLVCLEGIPRLLQVLRGEPDLAMVIGSIRAVPGISGVANTGIIDQNSLLHCGQEALGGLGFGRTYISGTIFNRDFICHHRLFERVWEKIDEHAVYPHLYIEALLCTQGNVRRLPETLCLAGQAENRDALYLGTGPAYSFEARLRQHKLFTEVLIEVTDICEINDNMKALLYIQLCEKTLRLVSLVNGPYYRQLGRDTTVLLKRAFWYCLQLAGQICKVEIYREGAKLVIKESFEKLLSRI